MTATMIDLDDEALEQARMYYGTTTKKDTVNRALRDAAARREQLLDRLFDRMADSAAEYERLSDAEKAAFRAELDATDHKFLSQVAAFDAARGAVER
jgi:Arc/MetJ family transcription regulator